MSLTLKTAAKAVEVALKGKLVPIMKGAPGVGKSDTINCIAKEMNLEVIDMRLSQCDPTDLMGLPMIQGGVAGYQPLDTFPLVGRDFLPFIDEEANKFAKLINQARYSKDAMSFIKPEIEDAYGNDAADILETIAVTALDDDQLKDIIAKIGLDTAQRAGWLLFLDELPNADVAVQQAAYKLVLDRMVASYALRPEVHIVAAGNREEDNCYVQPMPAALKTRLVHLDIQLSADEWLDWAIESGKVDPRVSAFIMHDKSQLNKDTTDTTDITFACPRTWEYISRIVEQYKSFPTDKEMSEANMLRQLIYGTVGESAGVQFWNFTKYFGEIPSFDEIVKNPEKARLVYGGHLFAVAATLMSNTTFDTLESVIKYVDRMDEKEVQFLIVRGLLTANKHDSKFRSHQSILKWLKDLSTYMKK